MSIFRIELEGVFAPSKGFHCENHRELWEYGSLGTNFMSFDGDDLKQEKTILLLF